jgi:endonuclease/exonuclease/phosphatase family metal-dependent hydrolase
VTIEPGACLSGVIPTERAEESTDPSEAKISPPTPWIGPLGPAALSRDDTRGNQCGPRLGRIHREMPARFKTTLLWPLPLLGRIVRGYLGRRTVLVDELPPEQRPSALAVDERAGDLEPLGANLTVLSYNVQRGQRLERVAASIERAVGDWAPDLVFLQEAPLELVRLPRLAPIMGRSSLFWAPFHQVDRPDQRYRFRAYGQLIASTRALLESKVVELPTVNPSVLGPGHLMKRIALLASLKAADGRTVGVVNVHNEPFARPRDRLLQHRTFLEALEADAPDIAVCCGDFNPSFSQRSEPGLRLLEEAGFENAFAHRWRTLDSCFARGHAELVAAEHLSLSGSDHCPIVVRIKI